MRNHLLLRDVVKPVRIVAVDLDVEGVLSARNDILDDVDRAAECQQAGNGLSKYLFHFGELRVMRACAAVAATAGTAQRSLPLQNEPRSRGAVSFRLAA